MLTRTTVRALVVAVAMTFVAPGASWAQADAQREEAGELVEQGLGHARAGEFEQAADKFAAALRLYPHPEIMHNMARAQEELGNLTEAHNYFLKALEMDPSYTFAEEARSRVGQIEEALRQTHGLLTITSTPSQVEVELVAGSQTLASHLVTPAQQWVPAGKVAVRGAKSGFVETTLNVEVRAGADVPVEVVLRPIPKKGFLAISASIKGAKVLVDGEDFGRTPVPATPVPSGTHTVRVTAEGHDPFVTKILVKPDAEARVLAEMRPIGGGESSADGNALGTVGGVLLGGGGAVVVAGVVLHLLAFKTANDAGAVQNIPNDDSDDLEFNKLEQQVQGLQVGAFVSYGLAAALVGTGIVLVVLANSDDDESTALQWAPTLSPIPGGASAGAILRF